MTDIDLAASIIRDQAGELRPKIALTLGSGLGAVAELLTDAVAIPYSALPGFPQTAVAGHEGSLRIGRVAGVPVIFLKGRKHFYEGPAEAAVALKTMIRTMKQVGVETLVLTNAAGSLRPDYPAGSLVAISDHLNLTGLNPLTGPNDEAWGPRFPPQDQAWDAGLRTQLLAAGKKAGVSPLGEGVYAQFLGPTFETPAEVRMARILGADLVGMSTVVENIVARHCGLACVGISAVTNLGAGLGEALSHDQTLAGAKLAEGNMARLVEAFIGSLAP